MHLNLHSEAGTKRASFWSRHFQEQILTDNVGVLNKISLKFVFNGPLYNSSMNFVEIKEALKQTMEYNIYINFNILYKIVYIWTNVSSAELTAVSVVITLRLPFLLTSFN